MSLWIPITLFAAFMQNLRFMLQKHLTDTRLSTGGATFSRFVFAAPFAVAFVLVLTGTGLRALPPLSTQFFLYASIGGITQILATLCVVALFSLRNFTVGITLKKTETVQTAILSLIFLGETVSRWGLVAIIVGLVGVVLVSDPPKTAVRLSLHARLFNRASGLGLLSGALFGMSATGYRGASLALGDGDFIIRASVTLAYVTVFQTLVMGVWLRNRAPGQIGAVLRWWRVTGLVGLTGVLGSLGWFMAFTLENAAYVKALGQVELILTFLASIFVFHEKTTGRELSGILLVSASILLLVLLL